MKKNYMKPNCNLETIKLANIILESLDFGERNPNDVEEDWIWGDIFE